MPMLLPAMRKHRLAKGIQGSTVARQLGRSPATIYKAEVGLRGMSEGLFAQYKKAIGWKDAPPRPASKGPAKKPNGITPENGRDPAAELAIQALRSAQGNIDVAIGALTLIRDKTARAIEYLAPPL